VSIQSQYLLINRFESIFLSFLQKLSLKSNHLKTFTEL